MSEEGATEAHREYVQRLRELYGVKCPKCQQKKQAKQKPMLLLPQQKCKVDGYIDGRPHLTVEEKKKARAFHYEKQ